MGLSDTQTIIQAIARGEMVILMDDEDRENEGDLIMAAEKVTAEHINFMARYGRGLICLTLTQARCEQLKLPLMVDRNRSPYATNFTLSIEAATGVTTGISAADRARTVQAAVSPDAKPRDLVQPGHIFPLMARNGGVLNRAGHTEAGCDLARMAGFEPAAVIVEILNEDGSMARRADLEQFAKEHKLKLGTVADLIEYRIRTESTIEQISCQSLQTRYGEFELFTFRDTVDQQLHLALRAGGEPCQDQPTRVRVHLHDPLTDLLARDTHSTHGWTLDNSLRYLAEQGGVLVLLKGVVSGDQLEQQLEQLHELQESAQSCQPTRDGSRLIGAGSQILKQLGVSRMRLMGAQTPYHALSGFGLEIVEFLSAPQALR
ncbi:bifunctional 3,4-dihydroxy-2-butanone-4-phosphate synthase/GTP cyclohydrolase II [Dongshaea marina]|uniref:bifunctional 3,4-dihydroxy-2-butanone-4-phosphate synthase/GTP cyclohydrolase II n=1 Tax=Dongshaea marina TaxID=2047966 RepID=UPI000D3EA567|nr:bifunctional 3,4-dihydroxy-2-butanone-4-phosphate synthase/GTP cyclohydrolase II [Dongshaea marina]